MGIPDISTGDVCKYFRGNFHSICEGNDLINSSRLDHSLQCRFQHHKDPYLFLGPFQIEELHRSPFIVSFKNFVYNNEIDAFKTEAAKNLETSKVGHGTGSIKTNIRQSKSYWIEDRQWYKISSDVDTRGRKNVFHINGIDTRSRRENFHIE